MVAGPRVRPDAVIVDPTGVIGPDDGGVVDAFLHGAGE